MKLVNVSEFSVTTLKSTCFDFDDITCCSDVMEIFRVLEEKGIQIAEEYKIEKKHDHTEECPPIYFEHREELAAYLREYGLKDIDEIGFPGEKEGNKLYGEIIPRVNRACIMTRGK